MTRERRLGRGLAALLGEPLDAPEDRQQPDEHPAPRLHQPAEQAGYVEPPAAEPTGSTQSDFIRLGVYDIDDNPFQPRRDFSEPEIASLAESLKEHDMLQPILVRRVGDRYQLISGERRLRAAIQAGWSEIPARIREADDRLVAELAIVENLQRKDLNPIEKALSFDRYIQEHHCTQEDLANRIKIDRSTIANLLRLLELPEPVKESLQGGSITAGHARALLPLGDEPEQIAFCQRIRAEGLSVRDTERLVQEKIAIEDTETLSVIDDGRSQPRKRTSRNQHLALLEQELRIALGTKVDVRQSSGSRGRIVIHFNSNEEFERIRNILSDQGQDETQSHVG